MTCNKVKCKFPCLGGTFTGIWIIFFWLVPCFGGYIFYCIEGFCCSSSYKYLKEIMDADEYATYQNSLKNGEPRIWWNIQNYHVCTSIYYIYKHS